MSPPHLQIRNVSDEAHRALKARAALEGRSLSDIIREELDRMAARPSRREVLRRIAEPLLIRACELRGSLNIADGVFVALAGAAEQPPLTTDLRLARAAREHAGAEAVTHPDA